MIIALIGFMGTGKSSVGQKLAKKLSFQYCDTDNEIEKKSGLSIPEIFEYHGEKYFRQLEEEVLEKIVNMNNDLILSTGGGIVLSSYNRRILKEMTIPVLLKAGAEEIYERIKSDTNRPLLNVKEPLEKIRVLLEKRNRHYNEFELRIDTEGLAVEKIVEIIIEKTGVEAY